MYANNKKKLFAFNSVTGGVQPIISAALTFICIPVFMRNLGDIQYGIFSLIGIIGNLNVYANLSLDSTLIKYLSEQGKTQESNYDILTTLILFIALLLPLSIGLFLFKDIILLHVFNVPVEYLPQSLVLFNYLLVANFFSFVGKVFTAILDSEHKIYLNNLYSFINSTFYWGGIILVLLNGYGLGQIGFIICASALLWFLLVFYSAMKAWGKIQIGQLHQNFKRIVKKQLKYSMKIYTGSLLNFLYEPLTKILISNLLGVSFVTPYENALKIKANLSSVFSKLLYPIYPIIAHETNYDKLKNLIKNTSQLLFYLVIPLILVLFVCTQSIIPLWIKDNDYNQLLIISSLVLACLSLLLSTTVIPVYYFLRMKHPEKEIYLQGINTITNLFIIAVTFKQMGFYSVILANGLSLLVQFLMSLFYQKKYFSFYPFSGIKDLLKYLSTFLFIGLFAVLFAFLFQEISWLNVIIISSFIGIVSLSVFYFTGIIKKEDMAMFFSKIMHKR
jgi:O-antigen/teichoic acid export membrane protein